MKFLLPCPSRLWNSTRFLCWWHPQTSVPFHSPGLCPWFWSLGAAGTQCPALSLAMPLLNGWAAPQGLWSFTQISAGAEVEQLLWWWRNIHTFHREGFCAIVSVAEIAYLQISLGGFTINSLPSGEECAGGVRTLIILRIIIRACQTQILAKVSLQSALHDWSFSS